MESHKNVTNGSQKQLKKRGIKKIKLNVYFRNILVNNSVIRTDETITEVINNSI